MEQAEVIASSSDNEDLDEYFCCHDQESKNSFLSADEEDSYDQF